MTASLVLSISVKDGNAIQHIEVECGPSGFKLHIPAPALPEQAIAPLAAPRGKIARQAALLEVYESNPGLGPTKASRILGVSRQTIYNYIRELEEAGRIRRNGDGVEVIT